MLHKLKHQREEHEFKNIGKVYTMEYAQSLLFCWSHTWNILSHCRSIGRTHGMFSVIVSTMMIKPPETAAFPNWLAAAYDELRGGYPDEGMAG
eukprot:2263147-Pyramimonas_sp.AAC.1